MTDSHDKVRRELHSVRDTVESIWVAIVLALVLRAFMIEAFVIPTGSMAPRLMGEHWQLVCPACGYDYAFGAPHATQNNPRFRRQADLPTAATCPNCGFPFQSSHQRQQSRGGDRVLVLKYLYKFASPQPWDVVVFRNPQDNRQNYIKRLVGLPGEEIEIVHGDIFYRRNDGAWQIRRKPSQAQQAMWQVVYDNDYQPNKKLLEREGIVPPRWQVAGNGWDLSQLGGRRFAFNGGAQQVLLFQADKETFLPRYGYNRAFPNTNIDINRDVCSDLQLSFVWTPKEADCQVWLFLSSFEDRFRANVAADGTMAIWHDPPDAIEGNWQLWGRKRSDPLTLGESYQLALSNVDYRLTLSLEGKALLTSTSEQYPADHDAIKKRMSAVKPQPIPTPQVRIAAEGGPCTLMHVKVHRDVYYTSPELQSVPRGPLGDYARSQNVQKNQLGWGTMDNPIQLRLFPDKPELDEFFVLGDNSPQSLDGRAWTSAAPTLKLTDEEGQPLYKLGTVPRYNLIGKAFFVYWPAGFTVPGLPRLPILPNMGRMRLIR